MLNLLVCFIILLSTIVTPLPVFGDTHYGEVTGGQVNEALANTAHVRFLPPNPLYYLSRVKELFSRFFTASAVERARFDFMISSKRLKETYLLFEQSKYSSANNALADYSIATNKSVEQLKKARSQNQEIIPVVEEITDKLNYHEILLIYLIKNGNDNLNIQNVLISFEVYVEELNNFKPGNRDRFKILKEEKEGESSSSANLNPSLYETVEPTASAVSKKVIY